jgi:hypothetical protein
MQKKDKDFNFEENRHFRRKLVKIAQNKHHNTDPTSQQKTDPTSPPPIDDPSRLCI